MTNKEIRSKSIDELNDHVYELKQQLFALRFQNSTGQLENPKKITVTKKSIARILTIIEEKKHENLSSNTDDKKSSIEENKISPVQAENRTNKTQKTEKTTEKVTKSPDKD